MAADKDKKRQDYLEGFITPRRISRMKKVLEQRTRYIVCVLEDLYDPRNGSAVLRHCDALGIQEIHAIEKKNQFRTDRQVDMGTAQWLDLRVCKSSRDHAQEQKDLSRRTSSEVLMALKHRGYRIVATSLHENNAVTPETLNLMDGPVAVVFGSEKHGISDDIRRLTDVYLRIPMVGFVESFNISASAAIVFHVLTSRIRSENLDWRLEDDDAKEIYFQWVKASAPHGEKLIHRFDKN